MDYTMAIEVPAMDTTMNIEASSTIKTIINENDVQMEAIIDSTDGAGGMTTISEWIKDGYL